MTTSPPAAVIFSAALLENFWARTVSFFVSSPFPSTLRSFVSRLVRPLARIASRSTVVPLSNVSNSRTLTIVYSVRKRAFVKPRLGTRL